MAVNAIHTLSSIDVTGSSAFNLHQLNSRSMDPGIAMAINHASGQVSPSFAGVMKLDPMISGVTTELARFLTNVSALTGLYISGAAAYLTLDCYFAKMALGGVRDTGSTHVKVGGITKALIIPKQISATIDQEATVTFDIVLFSSDGTTAPWTYTGSSALPTAAYADEKFTVGTANINGTSVSNLIGITYDTGLSHISYRCDGFQYPTFVAIKTVNPTITLKTSDIVNLSTYGISGTAQSSTASNVYFKKMKNMGVRTADATAEHIKISTTASYGYITVEALSASNNDVAETGLKITPLVSAGAILTINTASAIT